MKIKLTILLITLSFFGFSQDNYLWIGGQGNWSDLNHWQIDGGSTPNEVPDGNDNVLFTDASFTTLSDTVFIINNNAACKTFSCTNSTKPVTFYGGGDTTSIIVKGSFLLNDLVNWRYLGKMHFLSSDAGNTIHMGFDNIFRNNILFEEPTPNSGEWILTGDLIVCDSTEWWKYAVPDPPPPGEHPNIMPDPTITLKSGTLRSNNHLIVCEGFFSSEANHRVLDIEGDSLIELKNGFIMNGENIDLQADNSFLWVNKKVQNLKGGPLHYNNIEFFNNGGTIKNTNIHTTHNLVTMPYTGKVEGETAINQWGTFKIDSLLIDFPPTVGFAAGQVIGQFDTINYTYISGWGEIMGDNFLLNHLEFGNVSLHSFIFGNDNVIDSAFFKTAKARDGNQGMIIGKNTVNYVMFETIGNISGRDGNSNIITTADCLSDGKFTGLNEIQNLNLTSGCWYKISSDSLDQGSNPTNTYLQTIENINVVGDCNAGVAILTTTHQPDLGFLNYVGTGFNTSLLAIRDIHNVGNPMNVTQSIDLGNNSGITFSNPLIGKEMYWVNGPGQWDDNFHWSYNSGVTENQCPPTLIDNVHIDANAGLSGDDAIEINVRYAQCQDLLYDQSLADGGKIAGESVNNLMIWGSLEFLPDMTNEDSGGNALFFSKVFFESHHDMSYETIQTGNFGLYNKVIFEGNEGMWQVEGPFAAPADTTFHLFGEINFYDAINFPADTMRYFRSFAAIDTMPRNLILGASRMVTSKNIADSWIINAKNFNLDAGTSTIVLEAQGLPPIMGNMNTFGVQDSIVYHNVEAHTAQSLIQSNGYCIYNNITFTPGAAMGKKVGMAKIDSLTFMAGAPQCALNNNDTVNVVRAYSLNDTIIGGHIINQAHFYKDGYIMGYNEIDSLHYHTGTANADLSMSNVINNAIFESNAKFWGGQEFNNVWFTPSKQYSLQDDSVQIIHQSLTALGTCTEPILINSTELGVQARLKLEFDPAEVTYTSLRDLYAVPYNGNTYNAIESIDLGNNTNWNFTASSNNAYYWIDGTGDWGEAFHWSATSGGPPNTEGCTPREINDVFFDDNSFNSSSDVVSITQDHALCRSMYWTHPTSEEPLFTCEGTTDLNIYGSLFFSPSMQNDIKGIVSFKELGNGDGILDTIQSSGQVFLNQVWLNGINDQWILKDSLTAFVEPSDPNIKVFLKNGDFNTNGKTVHAAFFLSDFETPRVLNIQNSNIHLENENDTVWIVNFKNMEFNAQNSLIQLEKPGSILKNQFTDDINTPIEFWDIKSNNAIQEITNRNNLVQYHNLTLNGANDLVSHTDGGYYQVSNLVSVHGNNCIMDNSSTTHRIFVADTASVFQLKGIHNVDSILATGPTPYIMGTNDIQHGVFYNGAHFQGDNVFDTLILKPGFGATYYFRPGDVQTINDLLIARGNNCYNITLKSENTNYSAEIYKESGIVSSDFLELQAVDATGGAEFYAGANSSDPIESLGWIFEDSEGYIYGFDYDTVYICSGEAITLTTENFNTDNNTIFYWQKPGETSFSIGPDELVITDIGLYILKVMYNGTCPYVDSLTVLSAVDPLVSLDPGPYCEGDTINNVWNPKNLPYAFEWSTGNTDSLQIAELTNNALPIWFMVTDTLTRCMHADTVILLVDDAPHPDQFISKDTTLQFGTSITLNAGPGDTFLWDNDNPNLVIPNPNDQTIIGYGTDPVTTYNVFVTNSTGCTGEASVKLGIYPPCKYDLPNAFTPNGDGRNDEFYVLGPLNGYTDMNLMIFNRYGQLVFQTNDISIGWNGKVNGEEQENEVYTFHLLLNCLDGGLIEKKGNITLIR